MAVPMDWSLQSDKLAEFVSAHLVNRWDAYGAYKSDGSPFTAKQKLERSDLADHFTGKRIVGIHTMSEGGACKWACWDFDCKDGDKAVANKNKSEVIELGGRIEKTPFAMYPLIEDSNGGGGYHVWVWFKYDIEVRCLHEWAGHMARGLNCEVFPKQRQAVPGSFGNFMRLPGRHPKHDHWSRFGWVRRGGGGLIWVATSDHAEHFYDWEASDHEAVPAFSEPLIGQTPITSPKNRTASQADLAEIEGILSQVPAKHADDYDVWLRVGMACHHLGGGGKDMLSLWDKWSRKSRKHSPGDCAEKWATFGSGHPNPVTIASIAALAVGGAPSPMDQIIELAGRDRTFAKTWFKERTDLSEDDEYQNEIAAAGVEHGWPEGTIKLALSEWCTKHSARALDARKIASAHRTLQQGSGTHEQRLQALSTLLGHPIKAVERVGGVEGATYYLVMDDDPPRRIKIGPDSCLLSRSKFRSACRGHKLLVRVSTKRWDDLQALLLEVQTDVVEPDADPSSGVAFWIERHLREKIYSNEEWYKAFPRLKPILKDEKIHFHAKSLKLFMSSNGQRIEDAELMHQIRRLGFGVRILQHGGQSKYYRSMPVKRAMTLGFLLSGE